MIKRLLLVALLSLLPFCAVSAQGIQGGCGMGCPSAVPPAIPQGQIVNITQYGFSTGASAANNRIAAQAAVTAACAVAAQSPTAGAQIFIPQGGYNIDVGSGTPFAINCMHVSIAGAGKESTTLYPSGTGDLIVYSPPSGSKYGGSAAVHGFRVYRNDSATSGRCLAEDHVQDFVVYEVHLTGCFYDVENNASLNTWFMFSAADGNQTNTGSILYWVHHTVTQLTTQASTASGSVLPVNSTVGIYKGMVVTGSPNIPANDTISSWDSTGVSCGSTACITLASAITGTVGSAVTLVAADGLPSGTEIAESKIESSSSTSPYSYDYALLVQASDGIKITGGHIAWTRLGSMVVQPQTCAIGSSYNGDQIDNIVTSSNAYWDSSGGSSIDFEPCGGWTTTGTATNGGTGLTLDATPPFNVNNYNVQMTGVPSGTTVSSGGSTTSLTLSANGNSLAGSDATVTFYPAYSAFNGNHNIAGITQGPTNEGILLNDPALTNLNIDSMIITNSAKRAIHAFGGSGINIGSGVQIINSNTSNGGYSDVVLEANVSNINIGSVQYIAGTHAPNKNISVTGQAQPPVISGNFQGSYANTSLTTTGRFYEGSADNTDWYIYNAYGKIQLKLSGFNSSATPAYFYMQATGGTSANLGGDGAATSFGICANCENAGSKTINIGTLHSDAVVFGATTQSNTIYSAAGTALPTCNTAAKGTYATVSDATSPTYHGTYTPGGAVVSPVFCNGSNWLTD